MQDLRDFIKRQWMSKIGEQVLGGRLEEASLMGKLSDDVVQFIEKLIRENATLIQEIVESKVEEPAPERISLNSKTFSRNISPVSSVSTLASGVDSMSVTSKSRSRGGRGRAKPEERPESSSSSVKNAKVPSYVKLGGLLYSFSFSRSDTKLFVCCGGWDKSFIPWASYVYIKDGYPDEIKSGLEDSNKKSFFTKNLKQIAILSNFHWSQFSCADRVRKGLREFLSYITKQAPNAKIRIAGLLRKTESGPVIMYNTTLMHICEEFSDVSYVDVDTIPCAQKFFGTGLSKDVIKAIFKEVTNF
ncbi:unnamed protein product [Bursaphelenchus xylophilus]|uniref:(pine wood nematode) hypothetical protein n=1 Tax=Bursaphelenchus xylophilus TaxID=6326 RepID=A0A1I7SBI7_BURXY|nr:unnamed protein product [Bursaphelenchus xylophilus]CAG9121966.1 unnamed protein product [Bursaphelenchus xylophilus]